MCSCNVCRLFAKLADKEAFVGQAALWILLEMHSFASDFL
jgi:hypothetical protein